MKKIFNFLLLLAFFWGAGLVYFVGACLTMQPEESNKPVGVIVVLTGGENRIETALQKFSDQNGRTRYLFISGVHPQVTEFDIRRLWKGTTSLPDCCIVLGHSATTTAENAREVSAWVKSMNMPSIRLVTSSYHMKRARLELSYAMPGVKIIPHPVTQSDLKILNKHFWWLTLNEYNKYLVRSFSLLTGIKAGQ